ncbi:MAG: NAD(P)/FAD-dependent oxidoreductase [Anaerolineae bacterium]
MSQVHTDVIVVGAGPAGSTAALTLARAGVNVILVDKAFGANEKVCGGGLLTGSLNLLRQLGLYDQIVLSGTSSPCGARVSSPDGTLAELTFPPAKSGRSEMLRIVRRSQLDTALLDSALTAGAKPIAARALGMGTDGNQAVVRVERDGSEQQLLSRLVIAADGATGSFSKGLGIWQRSIICPAVRAYVSTHDHVPSSTDFHFFSECIPLYCWVFPLESGLCNVGLAVAPNKNVRLSELLKTLLSENPILRARLGNPEVVGKIQGGFLRTGFRKEMVTRDHLLVAGDAASLVSPLTGEGISQAMRSGMLAADSAVSALEAGRFTNRDLVSYARNLEAVFAKRSRQLWQLNRLVSMPGVMNRMVRLLKNDPSIQNLLARTLADPATWGASSLATLIARVTMAR